MWGIDFLKNLPAPKYERRPGIHKFSRWNVPSSPRLGDLERDQNLTRYGADVYAIWKMIPIDQTRRLLSGIHCKGVIFDTDYFFGANFSVYSQSTATPKNEMKVQIRANISMYHLEVKQIYPIDEGCYRVSYQALVVTYGWQYLFNPTLVISCSIAAAIYMCNMCTKCLGISPLFGDTIY